MRTLLLSATSLFLFAGGLALANGPGGPGGGITTTNTKTSVPMVKNTATTDRSSLTTTGATSVKGTDNTVASDDYLPGDITKTMVSVSNGALSDTTANMHVHARSNNTGTVNEITISGGGSNVEDVRGQGGGSAVSSGDANVTYANSARGDNSTVEQYAGAVPIQQNSVAIGTNIGSGTSFNGF